MSVSDVDWKGWAVVGGVIISIGTLLRKLFSPLVVSQLSEALEPRFAQQDKTATDQFNELTEKLDAIERRMDRLEREQDRFHQVLAERGLMLDRRSRPRT